jgi:hypothetical protein
MTKLNELTSYGQFLIRNEFRKNLRDWKHCSYWWKPLETDSHLRMFNWFKEEMRFRRAVLDGNEIESELGKWIGCDYDSPDIPGKRNVPQLSFWMAFEKAKKELDACRILQASEGMNDAGQS